MSQPDTTAFVRKDLVAARPAPVVTTGLVGFVRTRLLNSPLNIVLTIASLAILWLALVPAIRFLLVDAVWQGSDRTACLAENAGHPVGACWPFVQAKFDQLIYGFYPAAQRWRVNLAFLLAAVLLAPLLVPRAPAKTLNAALFFIAFPVVAFFLLHGGGVRGFALTWIIELAAVVVPSLRGLLPTSPGMVWVDLVLTAAVVSLVLFTLNGGRRTGWRALAGSLITFIGIAAVVALLKLDRGGLPIVDTRQWGGFLVTLIVSVTGIVASMPIGIALALGRRAELPLVRICSVIFIEFWRGVPIIAVIFLASLLLPLIMPSGVGIDRLTRAVIGLGLVIAAYIAEAVRGGLQSLPKGQAEAAAALGLGYWQATFLIILPQALRVALPAMTNEFISLVKNTTLVLVVSILDLLGIAQASLADPNWVGMNMEAYLFAGAIYWFICFALSRWSRAQERNLAH